MTNDAGVLMREHAFIGGRWLGAQNNARQVIDDPATGYVIGHVPDLEAASGGGVDYTASSLRSFAAEVRRTPFACRCSAASLMAISSSHQTTCSDMWTRD